MNGSTVTVKRTICRQIKKFIYSSQNLSLRHSSCVLLVNQSLSMLIGNSDLTINTFVKCVYSPRVGYSRLGQIICHNLNVYCDVNTIMSVGEFGMVVMLYSYHNLLLYCLCTTSGNAIV